MVIPNHLLVHAAPLRQCGLPVTRAHDPHSRHVVRRISSAVPPAPLKARSPHKAHRSQQPSMMRMPTPLPWDVQACVLSASLRVCSDAPVHPQSPRVLRFFDNTTLGVFHHTQRHLHEPEHAGSQCELLTNCRDRHHARHSDACMTWITISFIPTDKTTTRSVTASAKSLTHEWECLCWCSP